MNWLQISVGFLALAWILNGVSIIAGFELISQLWKTVGQLCKASELQLATIKILLRRNGVEDQGEATDCNEQCSSHETCRETAPAHIPAVVPMGRDGGRRL